MSLLHLFPNYMIPGFRAREVEQRRRQYAGLALTCVHDWPITAWLPVVECHKCGMRGTMTPMQMEDFIEHGVHPNTMEIDLNP